MRSGAPVMSSPEILGVRGKGGGGERERERERERKREISTRGVNKELGY
jgi:hypothetical protein